MRTLKKISLKGINDISLLDHSEMKKIQGGVETTGPVGTCGINCWASGTRVKAIRGLTKEEALAQYDAALHDADAWAFYDAIYWCCDSCD